MKNPFLNKIGLFDLQLYPWTNLDKHNVAKAIVLAKVAFLSWYPIVNAIIVITAITNPSIPTLVKNGLVKIDSFIGRGFSSITFLLCGSNPSAIAGKLSVSKLINNKCTGANGTGNAITEAYKTAKIPPKLPDNKNWIASLMWA